MVTLKLQSTNGKIHQYVGEKIKVELFETQDFPSSKIGIDLIPMDKIDNEKCWSIIKIDSEKQKFYLESIDKQTKIEIDFNFFGFIPTMDDNFDVTIY